MLGWVTDSEHFKEPYCLHQQSKMKALQSIKTYVTSYLTHCQIPEALNH